MNFIEDRLSGNKLDIFELQDAINDMNNTKSEIKNVCWKTDGENVPNPQAKFVDTPQDTVIYKIKHAFMNENICYEEKFQSLKDKYRICLECGMFIYKTNFQY